MSSIQPRKQRKALHNAPQHVRRKQVASHLSEELLLKYNRRSVPIVTGDEVKILRGGKKGTTGKVVRVDTKARKVVVDGINHKKADGTDVSIPLDPSNLLVIRLNLEDERRRTKLGATEEDAKAAKKATKTAAKAEKAAAAAEGAEASEGPAAEETESAEEPAAEEADATEAEETAEATPEAETGSKEAPQ